MTGKPCTPNQVAGDYIILEQGLPVGGPGPVQVAPFDSSRVMIAFGVPQGSANGITVSSTSDGSTGRGFTVDKTFPLQVLTFRDWGPLVFGPWFAAQPNLSAGIITVWTLAYRPEGGDNAGKLLG